MVKLLNPNVQQLREMYASAAHCYVRTPVIKPDGSVVITVKDESALAQLGVREIRTFTFNSLGFMVHDEKLEEYIKPKRPSREFFRSWATNWSWVDKALLTGRVR